MTVLVLDSPELIARAAALEAAQARTQVPAEQARVVHGEADIRTADLPYYPRQEESQPERGAEALACVI
ncbi:MULTISPECIES: hypothetical protein [Marinobacter]|uniref:Uncharacterized protein n=1 Tax=Marinobacter segnicrescens TaxID=430453 RepID=A0A1I0FMI7_9GAMM|nr:MULTISPECIES: hypothetical protein [Marinobacter]UZD65398.1 hypothetical protein LJ360_17765 [Marinobacter sp. AN1]SET59531.1 hypothetical protein SAMN04487962_11370 [Marinobacter segnicrescens]